MVAWWSGRLGRALRGQCRPGDLASPPVPSRGSGPRRAFPSSIWSPGGADDLAARCAGNVVLVTVPYVGRLRSRDAGVSRRLPLQLSLDPVLVDRQLHLRMVRVVPPVAPLLRVLLQVVELA